MFSARARKTAPEAGALPIPTGLLPSLTRAQPTFSFPRMSRLPFELLLALRYLRPKRTFVSIITLISIIGVALGVAVLIIVISVMSGFDKQMRDTILGFNAHLHVLQNESTLTNYSAVASSVASNKNIKGVAPFIMGPVMVETQPANGQALTYAPNIRGIDPQAETNVSTLPSSIVTGNFDVSGRGILIGNVFAEKMELRVGDLVNLYGPRDLKKLQEARRKGEEFAPLPSEYEVRGIFDVGYYDFNAQVVVVSLENAQDMFDIGDSVHGLMVMLQDPFKANAAKTQLKSTLGPDYRISTWLEESPMLAAVIVEKNLMLYILFFIVIVAAFGITCTTITFVVMKTREIGTMKALGASSRQVMWVFMGQSLVVSMFGIFSGLTMGLLALHYRNEFLDLMRRLTGMELFPASIYGFTQLPALIVPGDIAIICGGSLIICLCAAAFPARYASRLNPVEALRYE
ncbi:MAG: lipoprotein-releasing system permease protein [Verrucomicrobiota bacterium]|jgi:lipoprotein-releasing system permease protein